MPDDGRGQLLPLTWWARAIQYLKAHPITGLIAAGVAMLGAQSLRIGHLKAKQARSQKQADVATLERRKLETTLRERAAERRIVEADARAKAAEKADAAAKVDFDRAQKDIEDIAKQWPRKEP